MQLTSRFLPPGIRGFFEKNRLAADGLAFSIANIAANGLNYLFLLVAAILLPVPEFGVLGALIAIVTLVQVAGNVLQLQITHELGRYQDLQQARTRACAHLKKVLSVAAVVSLPLLVFSNFLGRQIGAQAGAIVVSTLVLLSLLAAGVANGYTAGINRLRLQATLFAQSTLCKFLSGTLLMFLGFGAGGAIAAYGLGFIWIAIFSFRKDFAPTDPSAQVPETLEVQKYESNLVGLLAVYGSLIAPFVLDQVLIQRFNPQIGGQYSVLNILGKFVFYICAPILTVLYSHACRQSSKEQPQTFRSGLAASLAVASCALVGWWIFGQTFGSWFLPSQYQEILPFVFLFSLAVSAHLISFLFVLFEIVAGHFGVTFALLPALVLQFVLFYPGGQTIEQATNNQLLVYGVQLGGVLGYVVARAAGIFKLGKAF